MTHQHMLLGYSVPYNNVKDDQNSYRKKFLKSAQGYLATIKHK